MRFFINTDKQQIFTHLRKACFPCERNPDYEAIAQFLYLGYTLYSRTMISSVVQSDPEKYYEFQDGKINVLPKNLSPVSELPYDKDALKNFMRRVLKAINGEYPVACSITGGTDSRAILSHILAYGLHPLLTITGPDSHVDVVIAKQISQIIGENIIVSSGVPDNDNWLNEAVEAADGAAAGCGIYRLYKEAKRLEDDGIAIRFGGGAGELYKNGFLNQDIPVYFGRPNWKRFMQLKVINYDFPIKLCGKRLKAEMQAVPAKLFLEMQKASKESKARAYLNVGYRLLQSRLAAVSNMQANWVVPYCPLMERPVVAWVYHQNPYSLDMHSFQREQVTQNCPELRNVKTDRGLTCNSRRKTIEFFANYLFLFNVVINRIFKRKTITNRVDCTLPLMIASRQYKEALKTCTEIGILSRDISAEEIPLPLADRILTIGTLFSDVKICD